MLRRGASYKRRAKAWHPSTACLVASLRRGCAEGQITLSRSGFGTHDSASGSVSDFVSEAELAGGTVAK